MQQALENDNNSGIGFEAIENLTRQVSLTAGAKILESFINSNKSDCHPTICHPNGAVMKYAGRRDKTFVTVLGEITLKRAYYIDENGNGYFPRDEKLGLDKDSLSDGVKRMIGHTASILSFKESSIIIEELASIHVGSKQVERTAEALGEEIAQKERDDVQDGAPCSEIMYAGVDGTGCPMRAEETIGRKGKQKDGTSKTREVKLSVFMSADSRNKEGIPVRDEGSVSYNAAIESAACGDLGNELSDFAKRLEREARRRGFYQAKLQVVIGDGAKWIWNTATELFPNAIQIIDLFHAKGTVTTAAKEIFGAENDFGKQWAKECRDKLEEGELDFIINKLEPFCGKSEEARTCREYLINNRKRLNYPYFRKLGLCTSSGIVESGCKHVIGARVKQSGMHWTVRGANAIIALRCSKLSGRFNLFMDERKAA